MNGSNIATASSSSDNGVSQGVWLHSEETWQIREMVESLVVSRAM